MIRPAGRWLIWSAGSLVAAAALLSLGLIGLLLHGPVQLDLLVPTLEAALDKAAPSVKMRIGHVQAQFERQRSRLELRLSDLELSDGASGKRLARIAMARLDLSGQALLRGIVAPVRIALSQPDLIVDRDETGEFSIGGFGQQAEETDDPKAVADVVAKYLGPGDPVRPATYLRDVAIEGARLILRDKADGRHLFEAGLDLDLARTSRGGIVEATLLTASEGRVHIRLAIDRDADSLGGQISFDHVVPADLAGIAPRLGILAGAKLPLSGTVEGLADLDAHLHQATAKFSSEGGQLELPALYPAPLTLGRAEVDLRFDESRPLQIDRLSLDLEGSKVAGTGRIAFDESGKSPGVSADLQLDQIAVPNLLKLWPVSTAPGGRRWIAENVPGGHLTQIHAIVKFAPGAMDVVPLPDDFLAVDFDFDTAEVHYLGELPPLKDARGSAHLTVNGLDLSVLEGRSGGVAASDGHVVLTDFQKPVSRGDIKVALSGSLADTAAVLDQKPLGYARRFGLNPAQLGGEQHAELTISMPLIEALTMEKVKLNAKVKAQDVAIPELVTRRSLTQANITSELDNAGAVTAGSGKLDGIPIEFNWTEAFDPGSGPSTQIQVRGGLSDSDRERLGISLGERLSGPISARADLTGHLSHPEAMTIKILLDLKAATLDVPELGIHQSGTGTANFDLDLRQPDRIRLSDVKVLGPGLVMDGEVLFDSAGHFLSLHAEPLRLAQHHDDVVLDVVHENEIYKIDLSGKSFDATGIRKTLGKPSDDSAAPGPKMQIAARLGEVVLSDDAPPVEGLVFSADFDGIRTGNLSVVGHSAKGGLFRVAIVTPEIGRRSMTVNAHNAAGLLEALGMFGEGAGGTLNFEATAVDGKADATWTGQLQITDMRVAKAPILAQLLTVASITGIRDTLQGSGILFQDISARITNQSGKTYIADGLATGPDLCFTVSGMVDGDHDRLDLAGAVVPLCTLNAMLGAIPVLGQVFVGRKNEGVFGVDYTIQGSIDDPNPRVNPLSPFAPGFLKKIFDVMGGPPDAPPKPSKSEPQ